MAKLLLGFFLILAVFFAPVTTGTALALSEKETARVEKLFEQLAQEDLVFIRNGTEYSAEQAVKHLMGKLKRVNNKLQTAEEFVDKVASQSSVSGEDYLFYDKTNRQSAEPIRAHLHQLLSAIP